MRHALIAVAAWVALVYGIAVAVMVAVALGDWLARTQNRRYASRR